jgi:hypothetical protein
MLAGLTAAAQATPVPLTLINGWTAAPFNTHAPDISLSGNIIQFRGAIATSGTNAEPFVLPTGFRPSVLVFVPVDLCNASKGRLIIYPTGDVFVQAETNFSNAQCFTSLDGASFALINTGFKPLALVNGWSGGAFSTDSAMVRKMGAVIRFKGAISGGTSGVITTLPLADRPPVNVFIPVDLCNATNGRLIIQPNGVVSVQQKDSDPFSNAQCFTSLDGAYYTINSIGFTPMALLSGWTNAPFGTGNVAAKKISGVVTFQGAVAGGTADLLFNLPLTMRPKVGKKFVDTYVNIDLCDAHKGRIYVNGSSGNVYVEQDLADPVTNVAQCFTSLDGVSFRP